MLHLLNIIIYQINSPVDGGNKGSVELEEEAKVGVIPDPHREGQEHQPDDGDVGSAVQQHHHVHQGELLHLRKLI